MLGASALPALAGWLLIVGMVVSNVGAVYRPIFALRKIGSVVFATGLA